MTDKGRHTDGASSGFYRDLATMVLGILALGAAIFLLLFWLAEGPEQGPSTTPLAAETTITTAPGTTVSTTGTTVVATTTTSVPTSTTVPVRPPEEVRVVVLNSMGLAGAAGRMTERLEAEGYQTLQADDYQPELDPSRIWFREGFSAEANVLLEFLPDAVVQPLEDEDLQEGADVILILGSGYEE